jgi:hypothetical protein
VALLSISPGEIELTRIPCSTPSKANWRVMPMIVALFAVWDSDGIGLKLSLTLSEANFTTVPRL